MALKLGNNASMTYWGQMTAADTILGGVPLTADRTDIPPTGDSTNIAFLASATYM